MKTNKEKPKQENPQKGSTHLVMEMKPIKKGGAKPGKLSKKAKLKSMKDDKTDKGIEEQVTLAQQAKLKVKIEDTVQDDFLMRPRTRSRVKKTQEEAAPQAIVEFFEDKQTDVQVDDKVDEVKDPKMVQSGYEEDIEPLETCVVHPKIIKMREALFKNQMIITFLEK